MGTFRFFDQQMMPKLCQHVLKFGFYNFLNPANQHPEPSLFPPRKPCRLDSGAECVATTPTVEGFELICGFGGCRPAGTMFVAH